MTALELRHALEPFMAETVVLVLQGEDYLQITGATYIHDDEGHLVLIVGAEGKSET